MAHTGGLQSLITVTSFLFTYMAGGVPFFTLYLMCRPNRSEAFTGGVPLSDHRCNVVWVRLGDATEPGTLGNLESIVFLQKTKFEARLHVEWQMRGCTFLLRALGTLESFE